MITPEFVEQMKTKLQDERARLEAELKELPQHTEIGDEMDESAQEVETDDVNRDLSARISRDLAKIDKALAKIEAGTYGTDDDGNLIDQDRLRVIPWADKAL